jgi:hypothetical protein
VKYALKASAERVTASPKRVLRLFLEAQTNQATKYSQFALELVSEHL